MKKTILVVLTAFYSILHAQNVSYEIKKLTDKNGYQYEMVTNDPMEARIYTLRNGLKVYLTVNKLTPRIQTYIAVRAGSTYDPPDNTGLAHYLEHMTLFKGTDKMGTLNWEKEKSYIDQISKLYEEHKATNNIEQKKLIYKKIDSLSFIAAQYAVPSEPGKIVRLFGGLNYNAHTSRDETVYQLDIPANEIERWLIFEKERFSYMALRFFHTEIESVYEEYNRVMDMDNFKAGEIEMQELFKKHPYGTQSLIGKPEHLKNPSMVNIQKYRDTYYVPNNMAVCMSGDLDMEKTIVLIDKYLGTLPSKEVPKRPVYKEDPITSPRYREVYGPNPEFVTISFRFAGDHSMDHLYCTLIDGILNNGKAGLIDLDLVKQQKVQKAGSGFTAYRDYGYFSLEGSPREGQTLEEVKTLLLGELDKIKKGEFEEWLLPAIINYIKLNEMRALESNESRGNKFFKAFVNSVDWITYIKFNNEMAKITKQQIVDFANKNFSNNYVCVYKRTGKDTTLVKMEKPKITPLSFKKDTSSLFFQDFLKLPSTRLTPQFIDYNEVIKKDVTSGGIAIHYIKNETNKLFSLRYIFDMGKVNNRLLPLAADYLQYIGTSQYTCEQLQKEYFKLGISLRFNSGNDQTVVTVSGLEESLEDALKIVEHIFNNVIEDTIAFNNYKKSVLKDRKEAKKNPAAIQTRMINYAMYGKYSPVTYSLSDEELKNLKAQDLIDVIKELFTYKHAIYYYGQNDLATIKTTIEKYHKSQVILRDYPEAVVFKQKDMTKNIVYFLDFESVQSKFITLSRDVQFTKSLLADAELFRRYFGSGFSSIFFQEIRESRALAYSASARYQLATKQNEYNYMASLIETQPDKLNNAIEAVNELFSKMPRKQGQFDQAKEMNLRTIESDRLTGEAIFNEYLANRDLGINYDIRKEVYEKTQQYTLDMMENFYNTHVKQKPTEYIIIADKKNVDMKVLTQLGEVIEVTKEEIFGY